MKEQKKHRKFVALTLIVVLVSLSFIFITAEPEGASITYISNTSKNSSNPDSRQDNKGTITTLVISTVQQNIKWKAYVGNVSGTLVLRDVDDYSIYEWASGGSPDGEVFITMNSSIDWANIECANKTAIQNLQSHLGHGAAAGDNIESTFSNQIHEAIVVGEDTITASTCNSTAMWVNDTAQAMAVDSFYQEVLLMDDEMKVIFTALIDQDISSYRDDNAIGNTSTIGANLTYDFQAIVPDYTGASIATYYFYVEIDS